jgi:diguanylate cyclase (GGDEF)-like protein
LGHLRGDEILDKLGIIIKETIRETDLAARYGGEEFSIVMSNTGLEEAFELAERIRKSVEINNFGVESLSITVSIGIALYPKDADCLQELLNRADSALYTAKRLGKNRLCSHSQRLAPVTSHAP